PPEAALFNAPCAATPLVSAAGALALRPTSRLSFNPATDEGGRAFSLNLAPFSLEPLVQVIAASPRPRSTPPLPAHHWRVASSTDIFSAFSFRNRARPELSRRLACAPPFSAFGLILSNWPNWPDLLNFESFLLSADLL